MTKALLPEEIRVRDWLESLGFVTEHEPDWLGGEGVKRPEFWAHGPHGLWIEVKRVTPPTSSQKGAKFQRLIKTTAAAQAKTGHGLVSIEANTTEQSVRWTVSSINGVVEREQEAFADHHFVYVNDDRQEFFATLSGEPATTIRVRGRVDAKLPASIHLPQERWTSDASLRLPTGEVRSGKTYEFFDLLPVQCVGRAQVTLTSRSFDIAAISSGDASNTAKLRADLKNAGKKFGDAVPLRPAPCIVVFVPDPGALVTEQDLAIAAFGDLTVVLSKDPITSEFDVDGPFLHRNGILRGGSYSSITGMVIFYNDGKVIVLNRRAQHPLEQKSPLFAACVHAKDWEL
jgi:hypothetical protein